MITLRRTGEGVTVRPSGRRSPAFYWFVPAALAAWIWDPLFLVWGASLAAGLWSTRHSEGQPAE